MRFLHKYYNFTLLLLCPSTVRRLTRSGKNDDLARTAENTIMRNSIYLFLLLSPVESRVGYNIVMAKSRFDAVASLPLPANRFFREKRCAHIII